MENKEIGQLTPATTIGDSDLFVLEQEGNAKNLSGSILKQYATDAGTTAGSTAGATAGTTAAQTVLNEKVDKDPASTLGFEFGCDSDGVYIRYEV